jgi:hypothetical protein
MNLFGKLAKARAEFHALDLKKSGKNTFAGYSYFELADFIIPGMNAMRENGLIPVVSFDDKHATMTIYETDGNHSLIITSPMRDAMLKGCHPIQNLGAAETYQRLLRQGIIVRAMDSYGLPEHIRISVGLPEENERFIRALANVLGQP